MSTAICSRQGCLVLPYTATSEEKAGQFADAIEALFCPCVKADVFEDGGQWGVAVVEGMERIDDPLNNSRIVAAMILLMSFDLTDSTGDIKCVAELLEDIPAAHKTQTRIARRQFRIEDKLDRILSRLDAMPPAEAADQRRRKVKCTVKMEASAWRLILPPRSRTISPSPSTSATACGSPKRSRR